MVTTPKLDLIKEAETSRMPEQLKWEWTRYAILAFQKFNRAFTNAAILNHVDPASPAPMFRRLAPHLDLALGSSFGIWHGAFLLALW